MSEVTQEDIAFVRSLLECEDKPTHESMFVPFFAAKIGEYRQAAIKAERERIAEWLCTSDYRDILMGQILDADDLADAIASGEHEVGR